MGRECSMNLVSLVWLSMALMLACGGPGDAPDEGSSDTLPDEATGEQGTEAPVSDAPSSDASQTGEDDNAGALTQPAGPTEGTAGSRDTASGSTGRLRLSLSAVNSAGAEEMPGTEGSM